MMVKPPLKKLESQVDSKYTLVTLAAKRARELTDGEPCLAESTPVSYTHLCRSGINGYSFCTCTYQFRGY